MSHVYINSYDVSDWASADAWANSYSEDSRLPTLEELTNAMQEQYDTTHDYGFPTFTEVWTGTEEGSGYHYVVSIGAEGISSRTRLDSASKAYFAIEEVSSGNLNFFNFF